MQSGLQSGFFPKEKEKEKVSNNTGKCLALTVLGGREERMDRMWAQAQIRLEQVRVSG